jgi:hypothetical protein
VTNGPATTAGPGAADLFREVGLLADGPVVWGRPVGARTGGIFIVELPAPRPTAPIELTTVGKWLERVPDLRLDGVRPTSRTLAARLAAFWLPSARVLYVGSTDGSIGGRVEAIRATVLGDRRPHSGGHWLHVLTGLERAGSGGPGPTRSRSTRTRCSRRSPQAFPRPSASASRRIDHPAVREPPDRHWRAQADRPGEQPARRRAGRAGAGATRRPAAAGRGRGGERPAADSRRRRHRQARPEARLGTAPRRSPARGRRPPGPGPPWRRPGSRPTVSSGCAPSTPSSPVCVGRRSSPVSRRPRSSAT